MLRLRRPRSPVITIRRAAAALLTAAALLVALRTPAAPAAPAATAATVPVTVAATDLPPGSVLALEHLALARLPADLVPAGSSRNPAELTGRVLAGGMRAREPVTDARLVGAGLTALLPAGQVAAPVRLADLAVTALVRTGDRVDVLATAAEAERAEMVAAGAHVLAVPRVSAGAGQPVDDAGGLQLLAVDGETAARLAAAATTGTLTVSLPPP